LTDQLGGRLEFQAPTGTGESGTEAVVTFPRTVGA